MSRRLPSFIQTRGSDAALLMRGKLNTASHSIITGQNRTLSINIWILRWYWVTVRFFGTPELQYARCNMSEIEPRQTARYGDPDLDCPYEPEPGDEVRIMIVMGPDAVGAKYRFANGSKRYLNFGADEVSRIEGVALPEFKTDSEVGLKIQCRFANGSKRYLNFGADEVSRIEGVALPELKTDSEVGLKTLFPVMLNGFAKEICDLYAIPYTGPPDCRKLTEFRSKFIGSMPFMRAVKGARKKYNPEDMKENELPVMRAELLPENNDAGEEANERDDRGMCQELSVALRALLNCLLSSSEGNKSFPRPGADGAPAFGTLGRTPDRSRSTSWPMWSRCVF